MFVPVVLGDAAVQAVLVLADPVPAFDAGFVALTLGSFVAVTVAVSLTTVAASAAVDGHRSSRALHPAVVTWTLVGAVLATVVSLVEPLAVPAVLVPSRSYCRQRRAAVLRQPGSGRSDTRRDGTRWPYWRYSWSRCRAG